MTFERTLVDRLRDLTGIGYAGRTRVFDPAFTSRVAAWPVVTVLPLAEPPRPDLVLASLLRRDLSFAGAISVLGYEDTPGQTFEEYLEVLLDGEEPPREALVAGVGGELEEDRVVLLGRLSRADVPGADERFEVEGPVEQLPRLTVRLAERFSEALGLSPDARARELWSHGRPPSWESLLACVLAWEEDDVAGLEARLLRGEVHPDALVVADSETRDVALLARARKLALSRDPFNPQLCFQRLSSLWKGGGRDSAAARVLAQGLRAAPGHGKSQMCFAHLLERKPENAAHILAHAEAGFRLLPGNRFAITNFLSYLNQFAPGDLRRGSLVEELLEVDPDHPQGLCRAIDFYLEVKQPAKALELARRYKELCTAPIDPETLYCFRQNPATAAELDSGKFKPLEDALRRLEACELAMRVSAGK